MHVSINSLHALVHGVCVLLVHAINNKSIITKTQKNRSPYQIQKNVNLRFGSGN